MSQTDRPTSSSQRYKTPPPLIRPINTNTRQISNDEIPTSAASFQKEGRFAKVRYQRAASITKLQPLPISPELRPQNYSEPPKYNYVRRASIRKSMKYIGKSIEEELTELGIDLTKPPGKEQWIPLEVFDDKTLEDPAPREWLKRRKESSDNDGPPIIGKGMCKRYECRWKDVYIYDYDSKRGKFMGQWAHDRTVAELSRLEICFEEENVQTFVKRLQKAIKMRILADKIIRYNYYIDKIPTIDTSRLNKEQIARIEALVKRSITLKFDKESLSKLKVEAGKEFSRAMNKFSFDKYLQEEPDELVFDSKDLPETFYDEQPVPEHGKIQLPKNEDSKTFQQARHEFYLSSLLNTKTTITALQEVRVESNKCVSLAIFELSYPRPLLLEDFRGKQDLVALRIVNFLERLWVPKIAKIVRNGLVEDNKDMPKLDGASKRTYQATKTKKMITMAKQIMQATLRTLIKSGYDKFYETMQRAVPHKVTIKGLRDVTNVDKQGRLMFLEDLASEILGEKLTQMLELDKSVTTPLLHINILAHPTKKIFEYSTPPDLIVTSFLDLFDKTMRELGKIPDPEERILTEEKEGVEFRPKKDVYLKVPQRPSPDILLSYRAQDKYKMADDENKWAAVMYESIKDMMEQVVRSLKDYIGLLDEYRDALDIKAEEYVKKLEKHIPQKTEEEVAEEIKFYDKTVDRVIMNIPADQNVSCFHVNCRPVITAVLLKYKELRQLLVDFINARAKAASDVLLARFREIEKGLDQVPNDIEELVTLEEYIDRLPEEVIQLEEETRNCGRIYNILDPLDDHLAVANYGKRWEVIGGPERLKRRILIRREALNAQKSRFKEEMIIRQMEFKHELEMNEKIILKFHQHQRLEDHEKISKLAIQLNEVIEQLDYQSKKFNHHESLFGMTYTDYSVVATLQKEFAPYLTLWTTMNEYSKNIKIWMNAKFSELDAEGASRWVEEKVKAISGALRFFRDKDLTAIAKLAEKVKNDIGEFKPQAPLMAALRKKGMTDRHWKQVSEKVGFEVMLSGDDFSFQKVLDMGLMNNIDDIVAIGERAEKEYAIETKLDEMEEFWTKKRFNLATFKNTIIIKGYNELNQILDEHIIVSQAMQFSPFKEPFEERINLWNEQILFMSQAIEEWARCQAQYTYLSPIFESPDISKQLPAEARKFRGIESMWKSFMMAVRTTKSILKTCSKDGPIAYLIEKLHSTNQSLEETQRELYHYLEKKRESFARFYFLSNDELLDILSQTKEPVAIQPHLRKVFENIYEVEFDEEKSIKAMFSGERERVELVREVDPKYKQVEIWLSEFESRMKSTIREKLLVSIQSYNSEERSVWALQHPGQCVLNGSQIHWTREVEQAIRNDELKDYWYKSSEKIGRLVQLVRNRLTVLESITINALIVIDVHAKDVVEKLFRANVNSISAFEWISQLRYYWTEDNCFTKCFQTTFPYGYEYLGNTLRLVITPLTDKCYITLMGAIKLNLGGAPAGPAGTGKTETTKDLAKALAKQCIVFNCSEGMDYIFVAKFFKGLASAGAWICFDEFNRINIEVLSVIAQQLLVLFAAKAIGKIVDVPFEGSTVRVNPTFSIFITMNPGYAGRTELPDNLKALFRPVAMMVPDYALIGEILLYSFGFGTARDLARKMVAIFRLCSEQLSCQDHYDYGMRAVRSVINAAGLLKRANPTMNEEKLLVKAIRDVNVPKFLKDDLPLFENIISDLFPNVERSQIDHKDLLTGLYQACKNLKLQKTDSFIQKTVQLYDTIQVRHGLMLVGPAGGGKTSTYKALQEAIWVLQRTDKEKFRQVHTHIFNPKAVTMEELYGWSNEQTKEWTNGILASIFREAVADLTGEKHWIIADGPVDALWIESMNTVLDDNKKLCLNSGQIIVLTPHITVMFEVEDLIAASPATVSRCGMIYIEPASLGIQPLVDSWIEKIPDSIQFREIFVKQIRSLLETYLERTINFVKKNCKEIVPVMPNAMALSLMKLLECFFQHFRDNKYTKSVNVITDDIEITLEHLFFFCLTWSVGCTVDAEGRRKYEEFLRTTVVAQALTLTFPDGSLYDYSYNCKFNHYEKWSDMISGFTIDSWLIYSDIVVPTNDNARMFYFMKLLLNNNKNVMCPGPVGTGKSLNAKTLIQRDLEDRYQYISVNFSAQTTAAQVQHAIDSRLDRRRRGYFGPPTGQKCVIFIDDLNMPKKETYGAQPPIELLRQYLDHQGWYDTKKLEYRVLEDLSILTTMGPPGGGRLSITNRIVRHFNVIAYTVLEESTVKYIFGTILEHFLKEFPELVRGLQQHLVDSVLAIYDTVKNTLKPTPTKSFYTFNLRDISKVFQGICCASLTYCREPIEMVKLWYHENMRVFHDRLNTQKDREFLQSVVKGQLKRFNVSEHVLGTERVIFGDFMQGRNVDVREYIHIKNLDKLMEKIEYYLSEYNTEAKEGGQMNLVMFLDACEHIARICRILRQPKGNALLLGVSGYGRQSLARLCAFISGHILFQIEAVKGYTLNRWREDLKKCLMMTGVENKQVCFLLVDTQIFNEKLLEDINNVLNTGVVPGLYRPEDLEIVYNTCRIDCIRKGLQPSKMNLFAEFLYRIQKNLHIVIAMSPLGEAFHTRIRTFPSLVNCTTIDWFAEWPEEALVNVGKKVIEASAEELDIVPLVPKLVEMFKSIHKSVEKASSRYLQELHRYNYITPTSFLELLAIFKKLLAEKRLEMKTQAGRLQHGLEKLVEANTEVILMERELEEMQPKLHQAEIELKELMETMIMDKEEADQKQKSVAADESAAIKSQEEALALQSEAKAAVGEAQKILDKTMANVRSLEQRHLDEIKAFKNPPEAVFWTLAGVCVMLGEKVPLKIIAGSVGNLGLPEKREDYFDYAKRELLMNPREFMKRLLDFAYSDQKNNIPLERITKFETKIKTEPAFQEEKVKSANMATKYLWGWVTAMYNYHLTYVSTNHLREKLAVTEKLLAEKNLELTIKKQELAQINLTIKTLEEQYAQNTVDYTALVAHKKESEIKLHRAKGLIVALSGEKERWAMDIVRLDVRFKNLTGDLVYAAGMVAYAGPFTSQFRNELEASWIKGLDETQLKHSPEVKLQTLLGDQTKIYSWNVYGLPRDETSIENGIIIEKSRRWPLMIDPQNQASNFIKNYGLQYEKGINVPKASDTVMLKTLEAAVQIGKWVLLENIGIDLDPVLDPLINQQIFKQGGEKMIKFRDKILRYHDGFKLFMTTTASNPHYSPETFVKLTVINFAITPKGLEDQMLTCIVALEDSQLEEKKIQMMEQNATARKELLAIEDKILEVLSITQGNILIDEVLVESLANSKKVSAQIIQRVEDSKLTAEQIDQSREIYRPVAIRASILFFCINDLGNIDPMYQYSLQWFIKLFTISVEKRPIFHNIEDKLVYLNQNFTYLLYQHICRSLFDRHKLLFSFVLAIRILQNDNSIDPNQWLFFLTGYTGNTSVLPKPCTWISETSWPAIYRQIHGISLLASFTGLETQFMENPDEFKSLYEDSDPISQKLPEPWESKLNDFERLLIIKALRPEKIVHSIQPWIAKNLGPKFLDPPEFSLEDCFTDSDLLTPLIFILSAGSDPLADFLKFAEEKGFSKKYDQVSLGQGQGIKADKLAREYAEKGGWLLLQNCHLASSWMPELQKIWEGLNVETVHPDFRLWLTSMPSNDFPIAVLQNGIKMNIEPPNGIRANLLRTYHGLDDRDFMDGKKPPLYKKLLFGFAMFHAVVLERRKFGPIGWNCPYNFPNEDFIVCKRQLKMFLDEYEEVPYKVLNYLAAEINYGGRVTDEQDLRLIKTMLDTYVNAKAIKDNYAYSESGIYYSVPVTDHWGYTDYIKQLPLESTPEAFGLHENAEIITAEHETRVLLSTILSMQPRLVTQSGRSAEEVIMERIIDLEKVVPPLFNYETIYEQYSIEYAESMNTVLVQEVSRYNSLLALIPASLANLKRALKGEILMTEELELMAKSIGENQVPELWKSKSFLSLKPLASWTEDLKKRIDFLKSWIYEGTPNAFWISGFFFPQSFITGTLQNCARRRKISIDRVALDFIVMDTHTHKDIKEKPIDGCYIYGMFLEGARWNSEEHLLDKSHPKELYTDLPLIWLKPVLDKHPPEHILYKCPLYKVLSRAGALSTTGHSTNFVMMIDLPTNEPEEVWIKAGVAAFLSLRY